MQARDRIAWNIRRLRTAASQTQEALSAETGVAVPYISGIERGVSNPTADVLERLSRALRVDIADLFERPVEGAVAPKAMRPGRKPRS